MIVVDTSAFVSLGTTAVFPLVVDEFDIHTADTVRDELEDTASYDDVHGVAAENVLDRESEFTVHSVSEPELTSSRIDSGEASCVRCCRNLEAAFLITDDLRALPELQQLVDTRVAISPILLKALVKRGSLEQRDAREQLETLAENRDWLGSPIYRRAKELFDE